MKEQMKLLMVIGLVLFVMIVPASAFLHLDYQNSGDATNMACVGVGCFWYESPNGGNSYMKTLGNGGTTNKVGSQFTYAAITDIGTTTPCLNLRDSTYALQYSQCMPASTGKRVEVKMVGGTANIYIDGAFYTQSPAPLVQNPSYFDYVNGLPPGGMLADDLIIGNEEKKQIFGMPERGCVIIKDLVNPAASCFAYPNHTCISNYNMTTTWGIGGTNASQTIILKELSSGHISGTYNTTAGKQAGSIAWPIYDDIINDPLSPYGYYITTIEGTTAGDYSDVIPYIADGATVAFNYDSYSRGDTAIVTYSIDSGGYWDTTKYLYRIDLMNLFGETVGTQSVTTQVGSKSFQFTESDPLGVYLAVLIAEPIAGGGDIWMNFDTTDLTGYLVLEGYPNDAQTGLPIPVANISINQGSVAYNKVTSVNGNYTTNAAFYSGAVTQVNVTSPGYRQYTNAFTPLEGKTIHLNFTLVPDSPTVSGIGIGGVMRDSTYGRPIPSKNVTILNSTFSESYPVTGNSVGYYLADETDGIHFANGRCYTVIGSGAGYTNSPAYFVCVVGT